MKEDYIIDNFISRFKDIRFNVICKPIKLSENTLNASEKNLKKILAKAKKELSKARKSYKHNRITSEELLAFENRVREIKEEIERLNYNTDI